MHNHLHFHIMDETLVGAVWFSILWILLPYAFWRSGGMETIQRQPMVEIGWILVPNYSGNSFLWTVLLCVGLE